MYFTGGKKVTVKELEKAILSLRTELVRETEPKEIMRILIGLSVLKDTLIETLRSTK
jgi:hypothetical protein